MRLIYLLALILFVSCISKYADFEIRNESAVIVPLAFGSFTLGDLFYELDEPLSVKIKPGEFHSIADTIAFTTPAFVNSASKFSLTFRALNVLPFQVDMQISPFDTLNHTLTGDVLFSTVVDAAYFDKDNELLVPVVSEHTLDIGTLMHDDFVETNAVIMALKFVWPHDTVDVSIVDHIFAFEIKIFLEGDFKN